MVNNSALEEENKQIQRRYKSNLRRALRDRSLKIRGEELLIQKMFAQNVPKIDAAALFWIGLALYWAEGAKTERWRAVFYNSDPSINKAIMRFFREICGISDEEVRIQLILHDNINTEDAISFWSKELSLPIVNFFKPSYVVSRASKRKRPRNRLPYGTVQISVKGKSIANKIKGWLLGISRKF